MTIPIHFDDYDVFLSPLEDFKKVMAEAGLDKKVIYLDRGDDYKFSVKEI
jgi:L-ascorbate metabolism protein UlaG (beta-lactamase superfamily)